MQAELFSFYLVYFSPQQIEVGKPGWREAVNVSESKEENNPKFTEVYTTTSVI